MSAWCPNTRPASIPRNVAASTTAITAEPADCSPESHFFRGLLDTGIAAETIFYDVPKAQLYGNDYVLIEAGPEQAGDWRAEWGRWKGVLPDLMYPADRSWLASTLWDDYWMSIGGSRDLVHALHADPELRARVHEVDPKAADMTPPHAAST